MNHHNTEHPHVHIVVRGVDAEGRKLRIPPSYIKQHMRERAQELGLRSEREIARQRTIEVGQERLTSLDRKLAWLMGDGHQIAAVQFKKASHRERPLLLARLQTLQQFALARPLGRGSWSLADGWKQRLRELGERGDIIKRIHQVAGGDISRYRLPDASSSAGPIEGIVRDKGLHDELTGDMFAAVETASGNVHPGTKTAALKPRDIVRVTTTVDPWVNPTDGTVARIIACEGLHAALCQFVALGIGGVSN